jgi:hypothetical protein
MGAAAAEVAEVGRSPDFGASGCDARAKGSAGRLHYQLPMGTDQRRSRFGGQNQGCLAGQTLTSHLKSLEAQKRAR